MRKTCVLIAICSVLFCSRQAFAACRPFLSNLDEAIGVGQIGQSSEELRTLLEPRVFSSQTGDPPCLRSDNTRDDCEFFDDNLVAHMDLGEGILWKDMVLGTRATALPFGLKTGDKLSDVIEKTRPFRKRRFKIERDGLLTSYLSGDCYVNTRGRVFSMSFFFDLDGSLIEIAVIAQSAKIPSPYQ